MFGTILKNVFAQGMFLAFLVLALTGCVSSTLDTRELRAVGAPTSSASLEASRPIAANSPTDTQIQTTDRSQISDNAPQSLSKQQATAPPSSPGIETAETQNGVADPVKRQAAVAEMRAKAQQGSGQKTQIGALPETAGQAMTQQEQQAIQAELSQSSEQASATVSDDELAAKRASMAEMRRKAAAHYRDALRRIEN